MFRLIAPAMLVLTLLAPLNAEAAPIVIDTFNSPAGGQTVNSGSLTGSFTAVANPGGIGGTRDLSYSGTNGNTANTWRTGSELLSANSFLPGRLALSTFDSAVQVDLSYKGFGTLDASGMGSLDLIFDTIFDKGANPTFDIDVTLTTSSGTLSGVYAAPNGFVPNGGTLAIPLSSFTGPGSLASITQIDIHLNDSGTPSPAADFALDQIQFTPVPEPATLALWGAVSVAGAWYGRRRLLRSSPRA